MRDVIEPTTVLGRPSIPNDLESAMLLGRKNNQSVFIVDISKYWDNERMYSVLVLWERKNIIAGRAMFQSRNFNTRLENAFEILLLRQIVSIDRIVSSIMAIVNFQLIVSLFFNYMFICV